MNVWSHFSNCCLFRGTKHFMFYSTCLLIYSYVNLVLYKICSLFSYKFSCKMIQLLHYSFIIEAKYKIINRSILNSLVGFSQWHGLVFLRLIYMYKIINNISWLEKVDLLGLREVRHNKRLKRILTCWSEREEAARTFPLSSLCLSLCGMSDIPGSILKWRIFWNSKRLWGEAEKEEGELGTRSTRK